MKNSKKLKKIANLIFWVFLPAALAISVFSYREAVEKAQLRANAREYARTQAHYDENRIRNVLNSPSRSVQQITKSLGIIYLLEERNIRVSSIKGMKMEMDYDVISAKHGELDIALGETDCGGCLVTRIPLYCAKTKELVGVATFYFGNEFYLPPEPPLEDSDMTLEFLKLSGAVFAFLMAGWVIITVKMLYLRKAENHIREQHAKLASTKQKPEPEPEPEPEPDIPEPGDTKKKIIEWLSKTGWTFRSYTDLQKQYLHMSDEPIIRYLLLQKIRELNNISHESAQTVMNHLLRTLDNPDPLQGNKEFLEKLVRGITIISQDQAGTYIFIDFKDIRNNSFVITSQYSMQFPRLVKTDMMLLVNGIPLVPIMTAESPGESITCQEKIREFPDYAREDKLFATHAFGVTCRENAVRYGIVGEPRFCFSEWKNHPDPGDLPESEKMKPGITSLLEPEQVLDIMKNFILFECSDTRIVKKVAYYQQIRAADKITDMFANTDLEQSAVWHAQGSGRSMAMVFTAHKLRNSTDLMKIYIITDQEQTSATFDEFPGFRTPCSVSDLRHITSTGTSGIFIADIRKLRKTGHEFRNNKIIILADEAHHAHHSDFREELQSLIPGARIFVFTGAPGNRKTGNYADIYSIRDSVKDRRTLPVLHTPGPREWFMGKERMKQAWEELSASTAQSRGKEPWKAFLKQPERIRVLAENMAMDFISVVRPQGYKARVIACDTEACMRYYYEFMDYFTPLEMKLICPPYSDEETSSLHAEIREHESGINLGRTARNFRQKIMSEDENVEILITCNMPPGFGTPLEQTIYLDSPLRNHELLQAASCVSRPFYDTVTRFPKKFGRIADYTGIFENWKEALDYDPEDIGEFQDAKSHAAQFPKILEKAFEQFEHIRLENTYECFSEILEAASSADHAEFEALYTEAVRLYESFDPDPEIGKYKEKYNWLNMIYKICKLRHCRPDLNEKICAVKTRKFMYEYSVINYKKYVLEMYEAEDMSYRQKMEKILHDIKMLEQG